MRFSRLKPICGIYKISNLKTGRIYIGQSVNILLRWAAHVDDLVAGRHSNKNLLADFQEYGLHALKAEIVEKCERDKLLLLARERYYISQYFQSGFELYNKLDDGSGYLYPFVRDDGQRDITDRERSQIRKIAQARERL